MLRFDNVTKSYADGTQALKNLTLEIPAGQFCVLLGPSGAGKSTLLRMANGLATPSQGCVQVHGLQVSRANLARIRPRIGMIHQQFNLTTRLSVATNVMAGALPIISTWRALLMWFPRTYRDKACELLQAVGLREEHLCRRVSALSGGQQQRVGIARAFMLDPPCILADEPVASLDPGSSREILSLLKRESRQRGTTVLCSLHQLDLAREFADRIIALRAGEIVFDGVPADFNQAAVSALYQSSAEAYAALAPQRRLLGSDH